MVRRFLLGRRGRARPSSTRGCGWYCTASSKTAIMPASCSRRFPNGSSRCSRPRSRRRWRPANLRRAGEPGAGEPLLVRPACRGDDGVRGIARAQTACRIEGTLDELVEEASAFILRGIGMSDAAIAARVPRASRVPVSGGGLNEGSKHGRRSQPMTATADGRRCARARADTAAAPRHAAEDDALAGHRRAAARARARRALRLQPVPRAGDRGLFRQQQAAAGADRGGDRDGRGGAALRRPASARSPRSTRSRSTPRSAAASPRSFSSRAPRSRPATRWCSSTTRRSAATSPITRRRRAGPRSPCSARGAGAAQVGAQENCRPEPDRSSTRPARRSCKTQAIIAQKLIRAPFPAGSACARSRSAQYVNPGAPIVTLTDLKQLYVNFTLPSTMRAQIKVGQKVNVTADAFPGRTFKAKITTIEPQIRADTRTMAVQATMPNPDEALLPGMFVNAAVVLPAQPDRWCCRRPRSTTRSTATASMSSARTGRTPTASRC